MGKRHLLDTNVIIDFCANQLPESGRRLVTKLLDEAPIISVINKIELLSRNEVPPSILVFLNHVLVLPIDDSVVEQTISLRRKRKIHLPDAIIAATASLNNCALVTRNI